jgi:dTDP-4-amino-4,6-dideoxygalactose transaminase
MIPFSPPRIDEEICNEVLAVLRSGWITTGPRTKQFEKEISAFCGNAETVCVNSATAGLEIMLRWFGVGEGDEVIVPAYTYAATANVVVHCGARPVFVDVNRDDFNISTDKISAAITSRTKVIMPVDFAGFPCDYEAIMKLVALEKGKFIPETQIQHDLGRILVLSDSAHSLGAVYKGKRAGSLCDASVFSFHAVKNLTTAEGGAIALNLPQPFNNRAVYEALCIKILHGQNKDALAKTVKGNWKYDIVEAGYKCNMTDIAAAMGLVELRRYDGDTLKKRAHICEAYEVAFRHRSEFELPVNKTAEISGSYHVYPLRIKDITEQQRDEVIAEIFARDVSVNVHFLPVPATSFYRSLGYNMNDYPVAYDNFKREISLPVYYDLTDEQIKTVADAVIGSLDKVLGRY